MREIVTTTDGREMPDAPTGCAYCQLTSAGHAPDCPMHPDNLGRWTGWEEELRLAEADIEAGRVERFPNLESLIADLPKAAEQ